MSKTDSNLNDISAVDFGNLIYPNLLEMVGKMEVMRVSIADENKVEYWPERNEMNHIDDLTRKDVLVRCRKKILPLVLYINKRYKESFPMSRYSLSWSYHSLGIVNLFWKYMRPTP